jgi:hypothetical protein
MYAGAFLVALGILRLITGRLDLTTLVIPGVLALLGVLGAILGQLSAILYSLRDTARHDALKDSLYEIHEEVAAATRALGSLDTVVSRAEHDGWPGPSPVDAVGRLA